MLRKMRTLWPSRHQQTVTKLDCPISNLVPWKKHFRNVHLLPFLMHFVLIYWNVRIWTDINYYSIKRLYYYSIKLWTDIYYYSIKITRFPSSESWKPQRHLSLLKKKNHWFTGSNEQHLSLLWSRGQQTHELYLVGGIPTPLKNMKVKWNDDIPNIWENKHVPNHQPDIVV